MLYTVHSAHARLMTVHVPVDVKVHILVRMYIKQGRRTSLTLGAKGEK